MNREEAIKELRSIANDQNEMTPLAKLARNAFQTAAMLRDEGMSRRVESAVEALFWGNMDRPTRVLICEGEHPAELNLDAVQGSMQLLADADEAYTFSGDKAAVLKHRDRAPEDIHVTIQRRPTDDGLDGEDAKMLLAFIDGDVDGGGLDELGTIHKLRDLAEKS